MKKQPLGDRIYIITNIIFCIITIIYENSKYDIRTMKLSEVSGRIRIKCAMFLLLSYLIYTITKKIVEILKKRNKKEPSEDKIYIIINAVFCLIVIIYESSQYGIGAISLSGISDRISMQCAAFLLLSSFVYVIVKKIIEALKKRDNSKFS